MLVHKYWTATFTSEFSSLKILNDKAAFVCIIFMGGNNNWDTGVAAILEWHE